MIWLAIVVALVAGLANPFQTVTNGELNKQLHQPIWAGVAVYATGLASMLLLALLLRQPAPLAATVKVSWWAWTGGVISVLSTVAGLLVIHKLGAGTFTSLSVTASLLISVLLDQFGLLGLRHHPLSVSRTAGCVLLVAGVWLVSRS